MAICSAHILQALISIKLINKYNGSSATFISFGYLQLMPKNELNLGKFFMGRIKSTIVINK